jgi:hypothetical protein
MNITSQLMQSLLLGGLLGTLGQSIRILMFFKKRSLFPLDEFNTLRLFVGVLSSFLIGGFCSLAFIDNTWAFVLCKGNILATICIGYVGADVLDVFLEPKR